MAAPVPYVSRAYDNRQYAGNMADLIGRRGDINTQANYARGMASANMVGNLAGIASNAISQYAGYKEQQRKEEVVRQEKERPRQIQAMVAGLPEAKREGALREMGEWEMADREANRQTDNILRRMNMEHVARVDANDRAQEIANKTYQIEKAPVQERAWHYNEALPELKRLAGDRAGEIPDVYDEKTTLPMLREGALTFRDHVARDNARIAAATKAAEDLQHDWKGLVETAGKQLHALGPGAKIEQWDGVIDGQPISADAKRLLHSVFATPTPETMAARIQEAGRLGGIETQPKTLDAQRVQEFARSRHPNDPEPKMNDADWRAYESYQDNRDVSKSVRTQKATVDPWTKPPTPTEVSQVHNAYNQQVSRLQATYDRTLSRVQQSANPDTPENATAIREAREARDTGIAAATTQRDNALRRGAATQGAAGEPMSNLVLPPSQMQGFGRDSGTSPSVPYTGPQPFFGIPRNGGVPVRGGTVESPTGKAYEFTPEQAAQVQAILMGQQR